MPVRSTLLSLACGAICGLLSPALAQPLGTAFRYQGRLTDGGAPANLPRVDFRVEAWDAATGGNLIGTSVVQSVVVVDGLVQFDVDFGSLFLGQEVWLEISFNAGKGVQTLLPRQPVRATPYALYSEDAAFAAVAGDADVDLNDAYQRGETIDQTGAPVRIVRSTGSLFAPATLQLGPSSGDGLGGGAGKLLINGVTGTTLATFGATPVGSAELSLRGPNGVPFALLEGDSNTGGGGVLSVRSGATGSGLTNGLDVDGNFDGTGSPRMVLRGDGAVTTFAMDLTGNASVVLPSNAIGPFELLNEPGVASLASGGSVTLTPNAATLDVITSWTISCPSAGYVLVMAQCESTVSHQSGTSSAVNYGVSDSPTSVRASQDIEHRIPSTAPTGTFDVPVSVHGVFSVNTGLNTFYFIGDQNGSGYFAAAQDYSLTLVYIPTAYGTIQSSREPGPSDEDAPRYGPMGGAEIEAERAAAADFDARRVAMELEEMRRRMAEIERQMAAERDR